MSSGDFFFFFFFSYRNASFFPISCSPTSFLLSFLPTFVFHLFFHPNVSIFLPYHFFLIFPHLSLLPFCLYLPFLFFFLLSFCNSLFSFLSHCVYWLLSISADYIRCDLLLLESNNDYHIGAGSEELCFLFSNCVAVCSLIAIIFPSFFSPKPRNK